VPESPDADLQLVEVGKQVRDSVLALHLRRHADVQCDRGVLCRGCQHALGASAAEDLRRAASRSSLAVGAVEARLWF
jgi:hypothetical protein